MNSNFDAIRNEGRLLYEYIRGSHLYGLNVETSDIDTSGVYMCKPNELIGLGFDYKDQVSDSKHDNTWYEIGNYLKLLLKSNPTVMESLFVPKDKIIGDVHPLMQIILDNKNEFITKACFAPLFGYAREQIHKARGLNKKIVNPVKERLTPFDFIYTFYNQGSTKIRNWLDNRGLLQKYCGLVNIPNMHDVYGVYYDWGNFFNEENITFEALASVYTSKPTQTLINLVEFIIDTYNLKCDCFGDEDYESTINNLRNWFNNQHPIGYRGMVSEEKDSNELRLSSVSKGETPICYVTYNQTGYTKHCLDYKNYKDWEKNRNPIRYESNLNKNYDSKNMMHCTRLIHMGLELAKGEGFNIERTWDREFLLNIRNHKIEYDELIDYIEQKHQEFNEAIKTSQIKEKIDVDFVNSLLIEVRKEQLKKIF